MGGKSESKDNVAAIEEFLSGPLWPLSDENARLPSREEIYRERVDELQRRRERSRSPNDSRPGSSSS